MILVCRFFASNQRQRCLLFLSFLLWKNEIKIRFTETPFYFFETKNRSSETKNRKNLS